MRRLFAATSLILMLMSGTALAELRLVMVEQTGCVYCARWDREIAPIYPKTAEGRAAPLWRVDKAREMPQELKFSSPVFYTPTFVLIEGNTEVGRIEGYPGEDFFWGLLARLIDSAGQTTAEVTQ